MPYNIILNIYIIKMSNRNHHVTKSQSKSPQLTNYIKMKQQQVNSNLDKDLIKQLILSKINQQKQPLPTFQDEEEEEDLHEETLDFKQEIEKRYKKCTNKAFKFPFDESFHDSESSIQSLRNTTHYNLNYQSQDVQILEEDDNFREKYTDATQLEFVKQVNEKLLLHLKASMDKDTDHPYPGIKIKTEGNVDDDDEENDYTGGSYITNQNQYKQYNYAVGNQKQQQPLKQQQFKAKQTNYNFSDTSLVLLTNERKLGQNDGRDSQIRDSSKPSSHTGFRPMNNRTPSQNQRIAQKSSESGSKQHSTMKSKNNQEIDQNKQFIIQQLLKITGQQAQPQPSNKQNQYSFYMKKNPPQQVQNNFVNLSTNINNNSVIVVQPQKLKEQMGHYRIKTEPFNEGYNYNDMTYKNKINIMKPRPPQDVKTLNYTMDQQQIDQIQQTVYRQSKSQNRNYKL